MCRLVEKPQVMTMRCGCGSVVMSAVAACVGPDQTRMTSLGKGSYLWLYFKTRPSAGRSTRSHLRGPNNPAVVYRAFPHDQPAVNCVALGHFGELGMCWLLFLSAFFLTGGGGFEATKMNKSLHSELKTAFPRPSRSEPVRCQ